MTKESQTLINEFHAVIKNIVYDTVETLLVNREVNNPLIQLTEDELQDLMSMSLTPEQINVLRKAMMALGQSIVFNLLCIFDGVYDGENVIPDLAIVGRNTNRDIAEQFWHDEFIELLQG